MNSDERHDCCGNTIKLEVIGVVHSCFPEKFGIPRQAGLVPSAQATIELFEPFNRQEMVRGLETFSHIWVQFLFHQSLSERWKTTVRPPRLGGRERVGVFATRSPHRPNHIGLSAVKLTRLNYCGDHVTIDIGGADLLDGTPVLDIKPYIPYSDGLVEATNGWPIKDFTRLQVTFSQQARDFCLDYELGKGRPLHSLITEVLQNDPRPASQRENRSDFGICLWDVNIRWKVRGTECLVELCEQINTNQQNLPAGS